MEHRILPAQLREGQLVRIEYFWNDLEGTDFRCLEGRVGKRAVDTWTVGGRNVNLADDPDIKKVVWLLEDVPLPVVPSVFVEFTYWGVRYQGVQVKNHIYFTKPDGGSVCANVQAVEDIVALEVVAKPQPTKVYNPTVQISTRAMRGN